MEYITIATALFLIAIGLLVNTYPNLIAGYNTMSAERKAKVDIEGLSTWMRDGFICIGVVTILGYYLLQYLAYELLANNIMVVTILLGTFIIAIVSQRFDHGRKR